jgi:hypothetical protein
MACLANCYNSTIDQCIAMKFYIGDITESFRNIPVDTRPFSSSVIFGVKNGLHDDVEKTKNVIYDQYTLFMLGFEVVEIIK